MVIRDRLVDWLGVAFVKELSIYKYLIGFYKNSAGHKGRI